MGVLDKLCLSVSLDSGLLLKLQDNRLIETVGIPVGDEKGRLSIALLILCHWKGWIFKAALEAHRCLNKDVQIGQRLITISTVGVPNTVKRLAAHKLQSTLGFRY
ncbi:hypothetical protein K2173_007235 [Erythroxylum novogranatense]|uniref:Uncharacterized protein n=1 Tax=Erythroxylum novogranatense TaxID=1862640 RepID=A0AAV8U8I2_9ROSI|nr:hypothetical protein K2173_007235 [Erythroxylum novogranatense]